VEFIGRIIAEVRRSGLTVVASSTKIKRSLKSLFALTRHARRCVARAMKNAASNETFTEHAPRAFRNLIA
jgi:hypothetical protein